MDPNVPTIPLKEYIDTRFDAQDKAINAALTTTNTATAAALAAAKEAVLKAEASTEKRFASVNEFRQTLADQQRTLMPRTESELRNEALSKRIDALEEARVATSSGQLGAKNLWGIIIGVLGVAYLIASWVMKA